MIAIINKIKDWAEKHSNILLYILIILVSTTITYSIFKHSNNIPEPQTIVDYREVQKWKDKYNNEHSTLLQTQLDKSSFEKQVDSISKVLNTKPSNIGSVTSIATKTETIIQTKIVYVDSSKSYLFSKKDNYLSLEGIVDTRDSSVKVQLGLVDTLTIIPYRKTTFFRETFAVDVTNKNPYNHIVSGYSFARSEKIKRLGLGPQVGYNPFNGKFTVGIGLQYNLIRF